MTQGFIHAVRRRMGMPLFILFVILLLLILFIGFGRAF